MPPRKETKRPADEGVSADRRRLDYFKERNMRVVAFTVDDPKMRERLEEAAKAEGRALNNWVKHYMLGKMLEEANKQLSKKGIK